MHGWDFSGRGKFNSHEKQQDSDIFPKAVLFKKVLRCILSVLFHFSGFRLSPSLTYIHEIGAVMRIY